VLSMAWEFQEPAEFASSRAPSSAPPAGRTSKKQSVQTAKGPVLRKAFLYAEFNTIPGQDALDFPYRGK
jgi:hypothetical protein